MSTGRYIVFEGSEGCGKSTHAARLATALGAVLTRETGGTPIGQRIRDLLHDTSVTDLAPRAEALLTAADRAQHIAQVVAPSLAVGHHVVSDRSLYSALAYQGYGRGQSVDDVRRLNEWAVDGHWPHLVLLLDVDVELLEARMRKREHLDRFEQEDIDFHARVRDGYRRMAAAEPDLFVIIDGSAEKDRVAEAVRAAVLDRLGI
ncbi:MAG: dTMP kinase [Actinomycetota bacterium]